jgi:hypothetical protein
MNTPRTPEELIKLARATAPDERVPYAFEKRVMAHLAGSPAADPLTLWAQALWRGVAPCVGVMAVALLVSFANTSESAAPSELASTDLESAVYAPMQLAAGDSW